MQILSIAASERAASQLSDAIVRTILKYRSGLLYGRIPMDQAAEAVEKLRSSASDPNPKLTLLAEIDSALASLEIKPIDGVKLRLVRAAAFRNGGEELRPWHLLRALVEKRDAGLLPTDPSAILSEALNGHGSLIPPQPDAPLPPRYDQAADPSNPLRLAPATTSLLRRAYTKQQTVFLNTTLGAKGLVAAFVTMSPEELGTESELGSVDFAVVRARFRDIARDRLADKPDQPQQWNCALEFESGNLPKLNNDQAWSGKPRDHLGISQDALAIANVTAGKATNLPLAFGIFGDWGAGKTFFMRLIYEQIEQVRKSNAQEDGFEHAIVQIQFNAWHYAETNLWASLVGHIFAELDRWMTREEAGANPNTADAILRRLATSRQLTLEAATELVQRRKEHAKAGHDLAAAQAELVIAQKKAAHAPGLAWRSVVSAASNAISGDEELKQQLGTLQSTLAIPDLLEDKAKLASAFDELARAASAGNAVLGGLRATIGSADTVKLAIAALFGIPLGFFVLRHVLATIIHRPELADIGHGVETLGGLLAMLAVMFHRFVGQVKSLADKFASLRQRVDAEIAKATAKEQEEVLAAANQVAQQMAKVEQAKTVLQATSEQVANALRDYSEETGGLRIRRFVRARAGGDGYGRHLGLVSTIRKDFEQLESLMLSKDNPAPHLEEARKHYEARVNGLIADAGATLTEDEIKQLEETAKSLRDLNVPETMKFRRIVLYIDDLDRCEPQKVVDVLQAVNMLLTFRLFVVLVAVDARWLSRSLEARYHEFFAGPSNDDQSPNGRGRPNLPDHNGTPRATPADYLEKIFQVPYWVPPMTDKTSAALVADLVSPDRVAQPVEPPVVHPDSFPPSEPPQPAIALQAEDDQPQTLQPPSRALGLTDGEIQALTALSPFLGSSPRRARRFVNVYRVAKASLAPAELKKLEDGEFQGLATQLAISTGAPNSFSSWVAACRETSNQTIEQRVNQLTIEDDERRNLEGALGAFRSMGGGGGDALEELAKQAPRATRFSFVFPRRMLNLGP